MAETFEILSSDGVSFNVPKDSARFSPKLVALLEDPNRDPQEGIYIQEINSFVLKRVVKWLSHHKDDIPVEYAADEEWRASVPPNLSNIKVDSWDKSFLDEQDPGTLFELILAANHLEIKLLVDILSLRIYEMMGPGLTPEQIRQNFGIPTSNLTDQEIECIKRENEWCMENSNPN